MKNKRITVLSVLPVALSLLIALGVSSVFSACGPKEDGTWMRCHAAQDMVLWVALGMAVVLAVALFVRAGKVRSLLYVAGAAGSIVTFLIPGIIMPMCMMQTMRCYTIMQPFVRIASAVLLVCCVVAAVRSWRVAQDA